uniref:Ig-like domain-containing protein n=1 Tax=Amphiprion percula TaxID=161767 RepID=A0A3P8SMA9_AMPPE
FVPQLSPVRPSIRGSEGDTDDITVTKGGDVTLQCAAEGVPRPAVTWLKDGRPITGQHGAKVLNEGQLLQIKDAKVSDTGRYTCIAVNVAGQADSKHDVIPPSIIGQVHFPENVSVVLKNPVALSCEASGIPLPAISWLKDSRPVKATSSVRILSGQYLFEFLDTGRYSCLASNSAGDRSRHFNLNVLGTKTTLLISFRNVSLEECSHFLKLIGFFCFFPAQFLPPLLGQALTSLQRR